MGVQASTAATPPEHLLPGLDCSDGREGAEGKFRHKGGGSRGWRGGDDVGRGGMYEKIQNESTEHIINNTQSRISTAVRTAFVAEWGEKPGRGI
jgi:hypothetical protein